MYKRKIFHVLLKRVQEPRRFIQVLAGPRQVGKTTIARQVMEAVSTPVQFATADEPTLRDRTWIAQQWDIARLKVRDTRHKTGALLILDEAQKVSGWSDAVKRLWDEDTRSELPLKVVLLGSSPLLVQRELSESLAGRFEVIPVTHWSYTEMREAFGWSLDEYVVYGGYPGAAGLTNDHERWTRYITDSVIETTVSRDILLLTRVDKPALLRRLFHLCCDYSGQVLSYQKMLGQLQDAGNTTTLAHYLELLNGAGLIAGLPKFSGKRIMQRSSSPKVQVLNTALMSAVSGHSFQTARQDREYWGRLVESVIGAHLINNSRGKNVEVFYWLERNREVDFVLRTGANIVAIEVKSGRRKTSLPGVEAFGKEFKVTKNLLVGAEGIPLETFLRIPPKQWMD